jgi:hypothetical protein
MQGTGGLIGNVSLEFGLHALQFGTYKCTAHAGQTRLPMPLDPPWKSPLRAARLAARLPSVQSTASRRAAPAAAGPSATE